MKNANTLSRNFVRNEVRKENRKGIKADTTAGLSAAEVNAIIAQYLIDNPVGGGGALFTTKFISGSLSVSSGASGDVITLTPPLGQRVRITGLTSSSSETNVSITAAGVQIISSVLLSASTTSTGIFSVGAIRTQSDSCSDIPFLDFGVDEEVKFIKNSGNTTSVIYYSYQFGE